jgi:hypothetical protein
MESEFRGLDIGFVHRVYRTSVVLIVLGAAFIWETFRPPAAYGWLIGSTLSLLMLWGVEWTILRFINPQAQSARGLVGMLMLKLFGAAIVLGLAFFGAIKGWISLLWVLPGVALPHLVIVLKLLGWKLKQMGEEGVKPTG